MKKLFLILLSGLLLNACSKDAVTPPEDPGAGNPVVDDLAITRVQNVFAINFSGTWCGPCGSQGIPALYGAAQAHGTKFHAIKVGNDDEFEHPSRGALLSSYYSSSSIAIPGFGVAANFHAGPFSWRTEIDALAATPASQVKVGLAIKKEVKGDSLIFNARFKAFENLPAGIYGWTVFVVEDNLTRPQVGQTGTFVHNMVYRGNALTAGELNMGTWGHLISTTPTAISANTVINRRFAYAKPTMNPVVNLNACYAYVVFYRLDQNNYKLAEIYNSASTKK